MTNGGIIEGHAGNSTGCSDLSPATFLCQSIPKTPMNVGERWETIGWAAKLPNGSMRVFHGAGTTDEEIAGQHNNIATLTRMMARKGGIVRRVAGSGGGKGLWPVVALKQTPPHYRRNPINPYVEKEARLRPQHFFIFGSRVTLRKRATLKRIKGLF